MNRKYLNVSLIAGLVLAVVFALFRWQISAGIVLGLAFYRIYFYLLSTHINDVIDEGVSQGGRTLTILPKIGRLLVLIFPFLAAYLLPEYIDFIGVAIGLLMFKVCAIIMSFIER